MSSKPSPKWRKSSYSGTSGGACVEVSETDSGILVRNSNDPGGPVVAFTSAELATWIAGCKASEFDDLA